MVNSIPKISILVISYNTKQMTLDCLHSVFNQPSKVPFEVIVIDNDSSDGTQDAIKEEFGNRLTFIDSEKNLGFCVGNNEAAKLAKGEYLLLLNPDTVVLDNAIDEVFAFAESNPSARIWGGRTFFGDHSLNKASCFQQQSLWSLMSQALGLNSLFRNSTLLNPEGIGGWNRDGVRAVDIVSGCFLLIKKEFWDELDGFNVDFFMYGEEADLCLRALKQGAVPMVTSKATIIHYGGGSQKIRADRMVRLIRGKMMLVRRHMPIGTRKLGAFLLALWPLTRYLAHLLLALVGRKKSKDSKEDWKKIYQRRKEWINAS